MGYFSRSSGLRGGISAHGFAGKFEAMGVVDEAIQDSVGVSEIADQIEPAGHWKLDTSKNRWIWA